MHGPNPRARGSTLASGHPPQASLSQNREAGGPWPGPFRDVQDVPAVWRHHDEAIEHRERRRGDREEVAGRRGRQVVGQGRAPGLRRRVSRRPGSWDGTRIARGQRAGRATGTALPWLNPLPRRLPEPGWGFLEGQRGCGPWASRVDVELDRVRERCRLVAAAERVAVPELGPNDGPGTGVVKRLGARRTPPSVQVLCERTVALSARSRAHP